MGQEYFINSQQLQDKVSNLLPSQGGAGAGFDLSASTQIIPIIDLTESAQGSNIREDLQKSLSFNSVTNTTVTNTTTTLVNNTGYYRIFGTVNLIANSNCRFVLNDGTTDKIIINFNCGTGQFSSDSFDFIVFLPAGDSLKAVSTNASGLINVSTRQIATIDSELVNP